MKREWYSYLSRSGFEDIERGLELLKPTTELTLRNDFMTLDAYYAKLRYYQWAGSCLTTCSFDSMVDKLIWEYHADGFTGAEISPLVELERTTVNKRVKTLKSRFKTK